MFLSEHNIKYNNDQLYAINFIKNLYDHMFYLENSKLVYLNYNVTFKNLIEDFKSKNIYKSITKILNNFKQNNSIEY